MTTENNVHHMPTIKVEKDGRTLMRMPLGIEVGFADDRFGFNGWPVEITVTLPSGHTEKWTQQEPSPDDFDY